MITPDLWPPLMTYMMQRTWRDLSMQGIAEYLHIPLDTLQAHYPDKTSLLEGFLRFVDDQMITAYHPDHTLPIKDRLFELMMWRLDFMAPYRPWITFFLNKAFFCTPCDYRRLSCQWLRSVETLCHSAAMDTQGLKGRGHVAMVAGLYVYTLKHWSNDTSPDSSATMIALNQGLSFIEGWLEAA